MQSIEQVIRDILDAAVADGLVIFPEHHGTSQHMSSGDLVGPANVLEQYIEQRLAASREPGGDAQQAAERAVERLQDTVIDGWIHRPPARAIILAEFAPLLAAKDEEIAAAVRRMEAAVSVANYEKSFTSQACADRDRLAAEVAELRKQVAELESRLERVSIDGKYD